MSQFNYILPSGAEFVVKGPANATQAEADRIFYEQVAAGSLVGYLPGQTLTSQATRITKFELSRLDRGTAGVDTTPILAIVQGLPVATSLPDLINVPLDNPIDEGDIVAIKGDDLGPDSVGPLSSFQTQKLLAQIANLVDQEPDQISQDKGIGKFGFTCLALEEAGYVKPGTSLKFFAVEPEDFVSVMSSPSVWSGKDGVYSLPDVLSDSDLQNRIQVKLMQQGYDSLVENGAIVEPVRSSISVSTGQVFTNSGLQSVRALSGLSLLGSNLGPLNGVLQNSLTSGTVINNLLSGTNINLSTIGSGAVNSLTAGIGNLGNLANLNVASIGTTLTNQINAGVGALVTNASVFGTQATALWSQATSLNLGSIGTNVSQFANSTLSNLTGGITGQLNNIGGQLTNLIPGNLGSLTASLNSFGQAASFATNFANPLGNLNNLGNLANLGSIGNLGNLSNLGNLGNLSNLGNLGNLGNLSNLGNLGNLGNLANLGNLGNLSNLGNLGNLGNLTNLGNLGNLGNLANLGNLGNLGNLANLGSLGNLGSLANLGSFANIGAVGDLFGGGGDLVSGTAVAAGFNNTVNRQTVDAAFARVVGSSKVPLPTFQYPSLASLAPRLDIQQAFGFLKNQAGSIGATFGQTVTI